MWDFSLVHREMKNAACTSSCETVADKASCAVRNEICYKKERRDVLYIRILISHHTCEPDLASTKTLYTGYTP